jgi:hypothetical protein
MMTGLAYAHMTLFSLSTVIWRSCSNEVFAASFRSSRSRPRRGLRGSARAADIERWSGALFYRLIRMVSEVDMPMDMEIALGL